MWESQEKPLAVRVLKQDALGRIELCADENGAPVVRRVAAGTGFPGATRVARALLARERRALRALDGLAGVARVVAEARDDSFLVRSWIGGRALSQAQALPRDYFERLEELVRALHARGVCHNDLHKEGNVLVEDDGYPALVDFQLASVHRRRGWLFASRAREDLRHVWKHRSFYCRALGVRDPLAAPPRRSWLAAGWRALGKPLYNRLMRSVRLRARFPDGEPRRGKDGPWPSWTEPLGPRAQTIGSASAPTAAGSSPAAPARAR